MTFKMFLMNFIQENPGLVKEVLHCPINSQITSSFKEPLMHLYNILGFYIPSYNEGWDYLALTGKKVGLYPDAALINKEKYDKYWISTIQHKWYDNIHSTEILTELVKDYRQTDIINIWTNNNNYTSTAINDKLLIKNIESTLNTIVITEECKYFEDVLYKYAESHKVDHSLQQFIRDDYIKLSDLDVNVNKMQKFTPELVHVNAIENIKQIKIMNSYE